MRTIQLLILLSSTIFIGCNQSLDDSQDVNSTNQDNETSQKTLHEDNNDAIDESICKAYHHKIDSLNHIKYDLFTQKILTPALQNPNLSDNNKRFLLALQKELQLNDNDKHQRYTLDHILYPVFKLEDTELAIFGNERYECKKVNDTYTECNILNLEYQLLSKINGFFDNVSANEDKLVNYPSVFKKVIQNTTNRVYLYTDNRKMPATITNFNYYQGNCLIFYHYPIRAKDIVLDDRPLFASTYPLDLIFQKHPAVDAQLKDENWSCNDCTFQYEPETIFATLEGVDNLYFTYTDTFNPAKQFDFPERALIMTIDDSTKVNLWSEDLDLMGCMCL